MNAIGMIEVFGLINAITVADECLKTANVNLIGIENVSSGIVTVKITGDVGAVTSAVNSAKDIEKLISHSVIPSIDEQALNILKNTKRNVFKHKNNLDKKTHNSNENSNEIANQNETTSSTENLIIQDEAGLAEKIEIIESEDKLISDGLDQKTVKELVEMVVKLKHLTYKDAKKLKKDELIEKLRNER